VSVVDNDGEVAALDLFQSARYRFESR
jgi:hypothetical protein